MNDAALRALRAKKGFLCDMDGVIYHGDRLLPGAARFVDFLKAEGKRFLFLTNSSERAPRELQQKLARLGIEVDESHFYTSALSTAAFLSSQCPGGSAYVIGEPGLVGALYDAGFTMNEVSPDYVVLGETRNYSYDRIERAAALVRAGAKLIGTNPDLTGPVEHGVAPACRALMAPIELASGRRAYYVGKPNPLMMRSGLRLLGVDAGDAAIIGDRMDTDIVAGVESGIDTVLVLSGVTTEEEMRAFPYRPACVLSSVGDLAPRTVSKAGKPDKEQA
ncbi:MAG: HAD-IIA family hydrolase [Eubacteriales bacterium]|nr:HAD-IIA family hydrolase [Eubacteriales bacterium]